MNPHTDRDIQHINQKLVLLQQQNELLKKQLMNNSLINELVKVMHTTISVDNIYQTLLLGMQEIVGFDRIIIFTINKDLFKLVPQSWIGITDPPVEELHITLSFTGGEITDAIFLNRHLIIEDANDSEDIFCRVLDSSSYLVIPIGGRIVPKWWESSIEDESFYSSMQTIQESDDAHETISEDERRRKIIFSREFKTQGVLWMDRTKKGNPVTSEDVTTVTSIMNQAGVILENLQIYNALENANKELHQANHKLQKLNEDLMNAQAKINRDLQHARTIQQELLPQHLPQTPHLTIHAQYKPADLVSGDYYDAFEIAPGIFGIIVADVSGHGVSSALIMTMVKVLLKTFAKETDSPQKTLEMINAIFQNEVKTNNFITVFYSLFDTNKKAFTYTSAGHCPVLYLNKKEKTCELIKADGLFLGVFPDMMLQEAEKSYQPGNQRLILYTDGLTEAKNQQDVMFEISRLESIAIKTIDLSAADALSNIFTFHSEFCGDISFADDDITLLVVDF